MALLQHQSLKVFLQNCVLDRVKYKSYIVRVNGHGKMVEERLSSVLSLRLKARLKRMRISKYSLVGSESLVNPLIRTVIVPIYYPKCKN